MRDCESRTAKNGRPNVREYVMRSLNDKTPRNRQQVSVVEKRGDGSV